MKHLDDPDEICVNCGGLVVSYYQKCPWCGKVWWKKEDGNIGRTEETATRAGCED